MQHITVSITLAALCVGIGTIMYVHRLLTHYGYSYLKTYLYYVLFLNVSVVLNLGLNYFLVNISGSWDLFQRLMVTFPVLFAGFFVTIIITYIFVIFTKQLVGKKIGRNAKKLFFGLTVVASLTYGVTLAIFALTKGTKPFLIVHYTMATLLMLVSLSAVHSLFKASRLIKDSAKKRALRILCVLYAVIFCWQIAMLFFPVSIIRFSSAFVLLALNAVPIYFLGRFLLDKRREAMQSPETQKKMEGFYLKHNLSQREKEVVALILLGKSNDQIKNDLFISVYTVKKHISNIFMKLNVDTRTQLYHLVMTDVLMTGRNFGRGL